MCACEHRIKREFARCDTGRMSEVRMPAITETSLAPGIRRPDAIGRQARRAQWPLFAVVVALVSIVIMAALIREWSPATETPQQTVSTPWIIWQDLGGWGKGEGGSECAPNVGLGCTANLSAIATDLEGHVYVAVRREQMSRLTGAIETSYVVQQYTPDGVTTIEVPSYARTNSLAVDQQQTIIYSDIYGRVYSVSPHGTVSVIWQAPVDTMGVGGLAVDAHGAIYVTAPAKAARVYMLSPSGQELARWGSLGSGPGQFSYLAGIAIGQDGSVYVADQGNNRIQRLQPGDNEFTPWTRPGQLDAPNNPEQVAIEKQGYVYTVWLTTRVRRFSPNGTLDTEWHWPDLPRTGGYKERPIDGLAVGPDGSVYALQSEMSRVYRLP
jgi:sugar lactone lactonase YvrE